LFITVYVHVKINKRKIKKEDMDHGIKNPSIGETSVVYLNMFISKFKYHIVSKHNKTLISAGNSVSTYNMLT